MKPTAGLEVCRAPKERPIVTNPATADLFAGGLAISFLGALWAWGLALVLGAALVGRAAGRTWREAALPWLVIGILVESQVVLFLGFAGQLFPGPLIGVAAVLTLLGAGVAWWRMRAPAAPAPESAGPEEPSGESAPRWLAITSWALIALFLACVLRFATWPSIFYDDLVYHLGAPRQALLTGTWPGLPSLHYTFMPAGWDASYALPLALGGGVGPQLMNALCLALLAWSVYRLARRGAGPGPAAAASALFVIAPVTGSLGAFAGNDLFVALALTVALERLLATKGESIVLVGVLAGAAWATKYTSLPAVASIGIAAGLLREGALPRRIAGIAIAGASSVAVALPWTIRSFVLTGSPLYPAFYRVLGGRHWNAMSDALVAKDISHGGFGDRGFMSIPLAIWDVLTNSEGMGYPSGINVLFVALGLVGLLLARRVVGARGLLLFLPLSYLGWCLSSLNLRYGLALFAALAPFVAALLGWVLDRPPLARRATLASALAALVLVLLVADPFTRALERHQGHLRRPLLGAEIPREDILVERFPLARVSRHMVDALPDDARVLLIGDGCIAHIPRPATTSSAYDEPEIARIANASSDVNEINAALRDYTHVVINYGEMNRFREQYRFDDWFEGDAWALVGLWVQSGLEPLYEDRGTVLYRIRHEAGTP